MLQQATTENSNIASTLTPAVVRRRRQTSNNSSHMNSAGVQADRRPSPRKRRRSWAMLQLHCQILLIAVCLLPLATPFANAGLHNVANTNPSLLQLRATPSQVSVATNNNKKKTFWSRLGGIRSKKDDPDDKKKKNSSSGGEVGASFVSKVLYNYATPLIEKAAGQQRLDASDAFPVPDERKMDHSVSKLTKIYQQLRRNNKNHDGDSIKRESWILTKSLLLQQRRVLLFTGMLRLANTLIQAFPALLVARLLRLVEAGPEHPVSHSIWAAVHLVAVLTVKMIIENQFFHRVVKCSTNVRGSLAGLLFDKSLRLQSGGANVQASVPEKNKNKAIAAGTSDSGSNSTAATPVAAPSSLGAGGVLNLMQSDASLIEFAALQLHTIWDGPLQIAIYTTLLYRYLGPSVYWGILVLLLTIPINSVTLRILNRLAKNENEAKDARTKRTAESINNMKLLKLQGWEQRFADDIRHHRREELQRHVSRGAVRALNSAISNAVPAIVLVVTLSAYVRTGRPIVASTIFTAISLFNQLRFPLFFYPMLIDSLANGQNAMRRIATFMSAEELVPYVKHLPPHSNGGGSIEMTNGNFLWSTNSSSPALSNVNLEVKPGEIVAVVGGVGSGKSSLIKGLLGELSPVPGTIVQNAIRSKYDDDDDGRPPQQTLDLPSVVTHGDVSYCAQEAWLPKGTIREAITFGREYDEERYLAAIHDAGLDEDIADETVGNPKTQGGGALSHNTNVGEGGSALSGGQRARVALARALYAGEDTKVFLLDDCLAALDASVGLTVFDRMTQRLRNSNAATILVTNDPSIPRRCDKVILVGNVPGSRSCSTIIDSGTYEELLARGHDLRSITHVDEPTGEISTIESYGTASATAGAAHHSFSDTSAFSEPPKLVRIGGRKKPIHVVGGGYGTPGNSTDICDVHADCEDQVAMENCPDYAAACAVDMEKHAEKVDLLEPTNGFATFEYVANSTIASALDEKPVEPPVTKSSQDKSAVLPKPTSQSADEIMSVGAVPRSTYISYFKSVRRPLLVLAMVASYFMSNGAQFFQQYTVAKWTEVGGSAIGEAVSGKYLKSLVNAAGVVSVFLWVRSFLTMKVGVRASEFFHSRMLSSVFSAPMTFFDATPSGQLLSRFGKEIETVDRAVPDSIQSVFFCFLQIGMSTATLAGIITPGMMIPLSLVAVLYVKMMSRFRPAARDLKRAETKTRSPIYTHFGEAIRGSETIRSIRSARRNWSRQHQMLTDTNLGVFDSVKALDRWLSTRLETLGNTVVFTAAVASVFLARAGRLKAGSAGWGLTQSLAITGLLTWAVRCLTDLESNMMSVMRVKELTDLDSTEVNLDHQGALPGKKSKMPKELSGPGEALVPLMSSAPSFNTTLSPADSTALLRSGWPWRGNVQFCDVSMRYNPTSPLVLKDVTISVPAGTTLGVVGRSGSGKSSLLLTLFRLAEIERGSIEIDGVDIRSIDMESLRQHLAIIPQDPVLFSGSIAYNLDATGKSSPEDMLQALEAASPSLAEFFRRADGLDTHISEGGKNLSQGQRQLLCLARALLRKSKILVLDEATSSVDQKTDQEVQETIRREFVDRGVTVITVAHRLDTVLGYDRIVVLGDGRVLEYGTPDDLVKRPGGELRKLVLADRQRKTKGSKQVDAEQAMIPVPQ